ncbi:MAG: hypothetical protein LBL90_12290 [Prevotellaceae bacterium]|jgi:hypothetical protein|nr:hypothetical protein [Prevotellaceae bacterium]
MSKLTYMCGRITKYIRLAFTLIFVLLTAIQLKAQTPKVDLKAIIKPDSILIGDHIKLSLQVTYDSVRQRIALPEYEDGKMGPFLDIIEQLSLDTIKRDGRSITIDQSYIVTSFDSGSYMMAFPMLLQTATTDTILIDTLIFPQLDLYVNTIPIDTATYVMYDIKAISEYPFVIWDYWWIGIIILGLGLIVFGLWWYLRWRKYKGNLFVFSRSQDPPYVVAFSELQKLKNEKLWEQDRIKQYYTRLTDIVRQYLEDTYDMQAMEKTSEEILQALADLKFDKKDLYDELKKMLMYSDLAKFAKYKPLPIENEQSYQYAYNFVDGTKTQPVDKSETNEINTQDDNNTEI